MTKMYDACMKKIWTATYRTGYRSVPVQFVPKSLMNAQQVRLTKPAKTSYRNFEIVELVFIIVSNLVYEVYVYVKIQ